MSFTLVTNRAASVGRVLAAHGLSDELALREQAFQLELPADLPFRSAHHKLELLGSFARGELGDLVALLDLDCVVLRRFAISADAAVTAYDISDQVLPAYGERRVAADLSRLLGRDCGQPRWFGGEFIAGTPAAFARLVGEIGALWPRYLDGLDRFHHIGDEMLLSAACLSLRERGGAVRDAGSDGVVARWWSGRTLAPLAPLSEAERRAVLHLPADKAYLARRAREPFERDPFLRRFRRHAGRERQVAMLKILVDGLRGRARQHAPRLS
jgi:hypothetical protein